MAIERINSYEDLVNYLVENNVPYKPEPDKLALEVPMVMPGLSGVVYIRWEKALPYCQVIHAFLGDVPESRVGEMEAAICRVNTIIPLPGFGFEYSKRLVFMRLCVQTYGEGVPAVAFQRQVLAVLQNAKEFGAAFADVAAGAPGKDIIELAIKHNTPPGAGAPSA